eukprot:Mycagemm_TRINITY_DN2498_c0_g1::TRINITY_DN2498_c0_g1_i1::g.2671::m.2671 type:complete len:104 gc:universal TRINITY_DN2498_c0_g1_i1:611-300(-)
MSGSSWNTEQQAGDHLLCSFPMPRLAMARSFSSWPFLSFAMRMGPFSFDCMGSDTGRTPVLSSSGNRSSEVTSLVASSQVTERNISVEQFGQRSSQLHSKRCL